MTEYKCGEDLDGSCAKGETICCGVCPRLEECRVDDDVCFFLENPNAKWQECESLIIVSTKEEKEVKAEE